MRTTFNLDDNLVREAEKWGIQEGRTPTPQVEEALRSLLARHKQRRIFQVQWPTRRGEALPTMEIANRNAFFEVMEGRR